MLSLNNIDVCFSHAKSSDKQELMDLWILCFDEKYEAAQLFFDNCFQPETAYIASADGKIISALYLLAGDYNGLQSHYLCGAATHPEYRKNGVMGRLIEFALSDAKAKGDVLSFLFPANEGLYDFYSRFGYEKMCTAALCSADREEVEKISQKTSDTHKSTKEKNVFIMGEDLTQFSSQYYEVYGVKSIADKDFLAFFSEKANTAEVFTCLCDEADFPRFCKRLLEETTAEDFVFILKEKNSLLKNFKKINHGMLLVLDDKYTIKNDAHIGITLN